MPQPDEVSLGTDARERLQSLLAAIRGAEREYELMLYMERFFGIQAEVRHYFSLIESEILDKLRELRETAEADLPPSRSTEPRTVFVPQDPRGRSAEN